MSTNLYLSNSIMQAEGFSNTPNPDRPAERRMLYGGFQISGREELNLHVIFNDDDNVVPKALEPYVTKTTFRDHLRTIEKREAGIYNLRTAKAEVEHTSPGGNSSHLVYWVKIEGSSLADVRELYHLIRTGTITASESYDGKQQGKTRAELEAELATETARLQRELQDVRLELRHCELQNEKWFDKFNLEHRRVLEISRIIGKILRRGKLLWWPWCSKKRVGALLHNTLNDVPEEK